MKLVQSQYNRFGRTPEAKKRYGYRWQKIRAAYLASHPLCEICKRVGKYVDASEVHHVKPLADGGTNDFDNLMALCKPCHSRITAAGVIASRVTSHARVTAPTEGEGAEKACQLAPL